MCEVPSTREQSQGTMAWSLTTVLFLSITVTLTDAECHCNTAAACAVFPSTPCSQVGDPDRCQEGWFGSYCQRQNIALRRSATQSSTYSENSARTGNTEHRFEARYGVDGRATTDVFSKPLTCTSTDDGDQQPTWNVHLNNSNTDKIQHIQLYLRQDMLERNRGMKIHVGGQLCFQWSTDADPPVIADVKCQQALTGSTLTIQRSGYLTLCEVLIFVCSDGWFGEDCDKQCRCSQNTEVCDKIIGQCQSGCAPGYTGTDCQTACPDGRYGPNCVSPCGHCQGTDVCDRVTGKCPEGCQRGWWPDLCSKACSDGRYGHRCHSQCGQCKTNMPCNKINGTCDQGCRPGFQEPFCKECADGMYGDDCMSRCGLCKDTVRCNESNGECPHGCHGNFMKPLCQGYAVASGYSNQVVPVAATFGTLLVLAVIALLSAIIYIRRLKIQLNASQKKPEDNYLSLDERSKDSVMENTYEHIESTATYTNVVGDPQSRI